LYVHYANSNIRASEQFGRQIHGGIRLSIAHMHSASVGVDDQDKALDFYLNTLGWEKILDAEFGEGMRFLTVAPPGGQASLVLASRDWGPEESGATGISFVTHDIDAAYAAMRAKGVEIKPVELMPWGQKATWFSDPDGNEFFLSEEPEG
jgi:catechol 2,3-dioxygenase-like lactoylglutathione lyase family enzyme